jgi:hypothetical protein
MSLRPTITRRLLVAAAGAAAAALAWPAAAQRNWNSYRNERFGTTVDYPADKFAASDGFSAGESRRFVAADGGAFTVAAMNNVLHQRLAALETAAVRNLAPGDRILRREHGPNWFALTGTRGNLTFYSRHLLSHRREIINELDITYPTKLRRIYEPIVARMAASFRAGVGIDTGPP